MSLYEDSNGANGSSSSAAKLLNVATAAQNAAVFGFHHQGYPPTALGKPYREDYFKESEPSGSSQKPGQFQEQEMGAGPGMGRGAANVVPQPMWAVAPGSTNGGSAFWMLPMSASSGGREPMQQQPGHQMWAFNPGSYPVGTGRVVTAPMGSMMLGGQQLGLGVAESNMAATMRGSRDGLAMTLDQHQHQHHQQHQEPNQSQASENGGGDDKK
ncbi:Transcription factor TCP22 [Raphanus sativus]|nr:Transcription factor TCP22 [Raphanus sativus]